MKNVKFHKKIATSWTYSLRDFRVWAFKARNFFLTSIGNLIFLFLGSKRKSLSMSIFYGHLPISQGVTQLKFIFD